MLSCSDRKFQTHTRVSTVAVRYRHRRVRMFKTSASCYVVQVNRAQKFSLLNILCHRARRPLSRRDAQKYATGASREASWNTSCTNAVLSDVPAKLVDRAPSVALAYTYLGDAVWELYARRHMILQRATVASLPYSTHVVLRPQEATKQGWSSSIAMCGHLRRLLNGTMITDDELTILEWGRDYGHECRSRHNKVQHKEASALEALIAYWYLFDQNRLHSVLSHLGMSFHQQPLQEMFDGQVESTIFATLKTSNARPPTKSEYAAAKGSVGAGQRERLGHLVKRMILLETRVSELEK